MPFALVLSLCCQEPGNSPSLPLTTITVNISFSISIITTIVILIAIIAIAIFVIITTIAFIVILTIIIMAVWGSLVRSSSLTTKGKSLLNIGCLGFRV